MSTVDLEEMCISVCFEADILAVGQQRALFCGDRLYLSLTVVLHITYSNQSLFC